MRKVLPRLSIAGMVIGVFFVVMGAGCVVEGPSDDISCTAQFPPPSPTSLLVTVQATNGLFGLHGITRIDLVSLQNATVSPTLPLTFGSSGTTSPIHITANTLDTSFPALLRITVSNTMTGHYTMGAQTLPCDPVIFTVVRGLGNAVTSSHVPRADHLVKIQNGAPALRALRIVVNGKRIPVRLLPGQQKTVDIAGELNKGDANTVVMAGTGPPDSHATVVIVDDRSS